MFLLLMMRRDAAAATCSNRRLAKAEGDCEVVTALEFFMLLSSSLRAVITDGVRIGYVE